MKELLNEREDEKMEEKKEQNPEVSNLKETKAEKNKKIEEVKNEKNKRVEELHKEEKAKFQKSKDTKREQKIEMQKMQAKKKRKKALIITGIVIVALLLIMGVSTIFSVLTLSNDKITSGVSIEGIEISGLTKQEAQAKLELIYNEKKEKEIDLTYEDYETSLNPTMMEVNYEIEKAVNEAYLVGRKENIFLSNYDVLFTLIGKKNINVEMNLNEEVTKQTIDGFTVSLPGVVLESSYSVEGDELIITKGKKGVVIDTEKLLEKVKESLKDITNNENHIEIPVKEKEPELIDIDKIHEEICTEAKDAYYTKDPYVVYPEVEGVSFDLEAARALLAEEKEEYIIKLTITKPKVTLDQIGDEAFPDRVGTCTTRYDVRDVDRSTNLVIACQKLNGKVILPGETFSYNKTLGERTLAAGYKNGKVYEGGKVVDGIGGGICQISSTLYNAILNANLQPVERRNHQFVTSYIEAGKDATVVYGLTDFKFKNTRKYPVKIVASAKAGIATVSIYGIKEENEYTIKISTKVISTIAPSTQYIEDSTLPVGTEQVKQKGANGMKTETYITKSLNGKVVSTTLLSRDTYDAMSKIIVKGTKGAVTTQIQTPQVTQPTTPTVPITPTEPEIPVEPVEPTTPTEPEVSTEQPSTEE